MEDSRWINRKPSGVGGTQTSYDSSRLQVYQNSQKVDGGISRPSENKSYIHPVQLQGLDNLPGHKIVPVEKKTGMRCLYCQIHKIKTPSGWRVKTNYKCETCGVPLCSKEVTERNCFRLHHIEMFGDTILESEENPF